MEPLKKLNEQMVQNIFLIWLDNNIDHNNVDYRNKVTQLRGVVNDMDTFTDGEECIQFVDTIKDNKASMVISGSLGQDTVPRVHNLSQVDSIFILCDNKECHEQWTKDWFKIKGVFTEITPICDALKQATQQCEQNATPISFMATNDDVSKKDLDQLDPLFMYTQILKEILFTIKFEEKHIQEFIEYCREKFNNNEKELFNVKELEKKYRKEKTPIWWYTCETFLYPMLNTGLRLMDVDVIIKIGFFINDLHHHIKQLHTDQLNEYQSGTTFTLYRGQGISTEHFEQLKKTKGGLISFNNFLSTSKVRSVSEDFARQALSKPGVGILFVMTIDPSKSTTPFASIKEVGYYGDKEGEVLFSMHTVFRIHDIKSMDDNHRLYQVDLTLTSDNDNDLCALTDRIRKETEGSTGWDQLGELLLKLGQAEKALQVYEILLEQSTTEIEEACIYYKMGKAKGQLAKYEEALTDYEKSVKIRQQLLPSNHLDLAKSYHNIGWMYHNMAKYSKALSYYEKALEIRQQSLPSNHPDLAISYNNIGLLYHKMGDYSKALSYYEKALEILQQSLPPTHPDLAMSHNNIGNMYCNLGKYPKALSYYEKALEIRQQSLPPNHPDSAISYNSIGNVCSKMGEYSKALSSHEQALEIWKQSLRPNHPRLAISYNNIGSVYHKMDDYSKTLSYYEKALEIRQQSLPPNHPDLAVSYTSIGSVYSKMGEFSKALSAHEKALEIRQQSFPPDHPDLAISYNNIGWECANMQENAKALSYCEKAIEIQEKVLSANHPDLGASYDSIALVYKNMGEYSKACSFYERAVEIGEQSLPSDDPELQICRQNLEEMKRKCN